MSPDSESESEPEPELSSEASEIEVLKTLLGAKDEMEALTKELTSRSIEDLIRIELEEYFRSMNAALKSMPGLDARIVYFGMSPSNGKQDERALSRRS
jgi:hypothetical protein